MKLKILIIIVLVVSLIAIQGEQITSKKISKEKVEKEGILLKSRNFIGEKKSGIESSGLLSIFSESLSESYVIIQFYHIPSEEDKKVLRGEGIYLLEYIPNNAWIAKITGNLGAINSRSEVKYLEKLRPEDKIDPTVLEERRDWYKEGNELILKVTFFGSKSFNDYEKLVESYGSIVFKAGDEWEIKIPENVLYDFASENEVKWITYKNPSLNLLNNGSRIATSTGIVQDDPYNLTGNGIVVAVWDQGWAESTHSGLTPRVSIGDNASSGSVTCNGAGDSGNCAFKNHATHVSGTVAGNGSSNGIYKGMATSANITAYEWPDSASEVILEANHSIIVYGASISQNSWGYTINSNTCGAIGKYDSESQAYDNVSRGIGVDGKMTIVFAAGNDRTNSVCNIPSNQYNTTPGPGQTSKNTITVGAIDSDDLAMIDFSAWGPTDDGRLKPEIVAPGCEDEPNRNDNNPSKTIYSTYTGNSYSGSCGTSMAAPVVSGIIALIVEDYKNKTGLPPLPSTNKAIITHTADDLNETGPDFTTGYGLINATKAINLVRNNDNTVLHIDEGNITSNRQNITYNIYVSNTSDTLKITLAWDDYPGSVAASKELVNDLDLIVIAPNGSRYYPWTLDANSPNTGAVRSSENTLDPLEQVVVDSPSIGKWKINVTAISAPQLNQTFSVVSSHNLNYTSPIINLTSPANDSVQATGIISFNCSSEDSADNNFDLVNVSLWINSTGTFSANQTINITNTPNTSNISIFSLSLVEDNYVWNCQVYNNISESAFAPQNYTLTVSDPPQWANRSINIVTTFSSTLSLFNITWTDSSAIGTVLIEGNWSETVNYTMNNIGGNVYHFNSTLPAGTFYWKSYSNDTLGSMNETDIQTFTIEKAESGLNLLLNGTNGNSSILEDTISNLTVNLTENDTVALYVNNTLYENKSTVYSNLSVFINPGNYNITAIYNGNENYTANITTWFLTVNDTTNPTLNSGSISPGFVLLGDNITVTANITDNGVLNTIWANISNSSFSINFTLINSVGNIFNRTYNTTPNLTQDVYNIRIYVNDTGGNEGNLSVGSVYVNPIRIFNITVLNKDGSKHNTTSFIIYNNGTDNIRFNTTNITEIQKNLPQGFWDILFSQQNFNVTFLEVNITNNSTATINLDDNITESGITLATNFTLFDHVVAVNTTLNFTKAQLLITYNETSFLSEFRIHALVCHNWNLTGQRCNGDWDNITNTSAINTTSNTVKINTTRFSAFSIAEHAICGDGVKDSSEDCDGSDFGSETCSTKGFSGGSLSCSGSCIISTSSCTSSASPSSSSSSGGGGGGASSSIATTTKKIEPSSPVSGSTVNSIYKPEIPESKELNDNTKLQNIIKKIINKELSQELKERLLEFSNNIIKKIELTREASSKEGETEIKTELKYSGEEIINNFFFYEKVPKTFANDSNDIIVTALEADIEIVKRDPEYLFIYNKISPNQTVMISYKVNKRLANTVEDLDKIVEKMSSEVYGESIEPESKGIKTQYDGLYVSNIILISALVLAFIAIIVYFTYTKKSFKLRNK